MLLAMALGSGVVQKWTDETDASLEASESGICGNFEGKNFLVSVPSSGLAGSSTGCVSDCSAGDTADNGTYEGTSATNR